MFSRSRLGICSARDLMGSDEYNNLHKFSYMSEISVHKRVEKTWEEHEGVTPNVKPLDQEPTSLRMIGASFCGISIWMFIRGMLNHAFFLRPKGIFTQIPVGSRLYN